MEDAWDLVWRPWGQKTKVSRPSAPHSSPPSPPPPPLSLTPPALPAGVYELLKENLMTRDDAVMGEAAGLAMGVVMIGTNHSTAIEDMLNVSTDET